ncbi:MAG: biopolymer transporter ExbD [Chthoniobacterales bacterium]
MASSNIDSQDGDIGFQIAPMVDVVFVLLLFFMAVVGSQVVEKELTIHLPNPNPFPGIHLDTSIIIEISPDGAVVANGTSFDMPTSKEMPKLRTWLTEIMTRYGGKDAVIIHPSPQTRQERIMDVLNAASFSNVTNLTFR